MKPFEARGKLNEVNEMLGITCSTIFKSVKTSNPVVNNSNIEVCAYPEIYFVNGFAIKIFKFIIIISSLMHI